MSLLYIIIDVNSQELVMGYQFVDVKKFKMATILFIKIQYISSPSNNYLYSHNIDSCIGDG